jgi:hypothetical protein
MTSSLSQTGAGRPTPTYVIDLKQPYRHSQRPNYGERASYAVPFLFEPRLVVGCQFGDIGYVGPLKAWQSSNIREQHLQIKIVSMKRLRVDYIRGMLATIEFRVFCHPACCPGM